MAQSDFDFTFDCPVYLLSPPNGGYLLTHDRCLCLWTDVDAAATFVDRNGNDRSYIGQLFPVEIATDDELLNLLKEVQGDRIQKIVVDVTDADQLAVRALHVADVMSMLQARIAEGTNDSV